MYELFLEHQRYLRVAKILTERGYRTRAGSKWSDMAVKRKLACPSARGTYVVNKTKKLGDWKRVAKPESEWGYIECEPLVSEEDWNRVAQIMETLRKKDRRKGRKVVHLFAGLAYCKKCEKRMYVPSNNPKYVCSKCLNKIPIVDLEGDILAELNSISSDPDRRAAQFAAADSALSEKEKRFAHQKREIQKVRDEMAKTHQLYLDGQIQLERFGEYHKPLEEKLSQLLAGLTELQSEIDYLKIHKISADQIVEESQSFYEKWEKLDSDDQRRLIESIIARIDVGEDTLDVTFAYSPTTPFFHPTTPELTDNQKAPPFSRELVNCQQLRGQVLRATPC